MNEANQSATTTDVGSRADPQIARIVSPSLLVPIVLLALSISAAVGGIVYNSATRSLTSESTVRAQTLASALARTVERYAWVPFLLANDQHVSAVLVHPDSLDSQHALDERLADVATEVHAEVLYLLDGKGITVASSNWDQPDRFIGKSFAYRPYFQDAIQGAPGQYIALGTTSHRLGYYLSYPVIVAGRIEGVVVAKLGMEMLEQDWGGIPEIVLISDENGVVVMTNRPEWRYRTIRPLSQEDKNAIQKAQRYLSQPLDLLPMTVDGDHAIVHSGPDRGSYSVATASLAASNSQVHVLVTVGPVWQRALNVAIMTQALLAFLLATWVIFRSRKIKEHWLRALLQRKIEERTQDLLKTNQRLKETQDELIQAAKMAALGQMSASIAHELSQPVAAIRSYSENAQTLAQRGRWDEVCGNLREIVGLTERMGRMSQNLKNFAYRSRGGNDFERVPLEPAVEQCLTLVESYARTIGAALTFDIPKDLAVLAEEVKLEQVLLNLVRNALDAVADAPRRSVHIHAERKDNGVQLSIGDSGPGIPDAIRPHLFESFFTTKPSSHGLGLGLSISRQIVQSLGGRIEAHSPQAEEQSAGQTGEETGGALFVIWLPEAP